MVFIKKIIANSINLKNMPVCLFNDPSSPYAYGLEILQIRSTKNNL